VRFFTVSFGFCSYVGKAGSLKLVHDRFLPHPSQLHVILLKSLPFDAIKSEHANHYLFSDNMKTLRLLLQNTISFTDLVSAPSRNYLLQRKQKALKTFRKLGNALVMPW
jgi:hypothetical protein